MCMHAAEQGVHDVPDSCLCAGHAAMHQDAAQGRAYARRWRLTEDEDVDVLMANSSVLAGWTNCSGALAKAACDFQLFS